MNWTLKKQRKSLTPREQLQMLQKSKRFLGVQISTCGCRAASRFAGKFFTFRKAPQLPVKGCDAERCSCQYLGVTDRRRGLERRTDAWQPGQKQESRKGGDRRTGPDAWKWAE
jgi:hypothetical protein